MRPMVPASCLAALQAAGKYHIEVIRSSSRTSPARLACMTLGKLQGRFTQGSPGNRAFDSLAIHK